MSRLAAVLIVAASVAWIQQMTPSRGEPAMLALGFTLVVATVAGELLRRFRLPRLTGYLLFGVLIGPSFGNVITEPMARQLQAVNGLATVLIAFIAGLALNFERLGRRVSGTARMIAGTLGAAMAGFCLVVWIAWPWLPVAPEAAGIVKASMVALFVCTVVSFSPTMTAAVISETGARGPVSDLVLAIVVVADLVALVLFSFVMQLARVSASGTASEVSVLARLAWEIGGATAFGSLVGALFALYLRYVGREVTLTLLGLCAILSQVGASQGFEPLLAALAAGLVIQNVAVAQGDALKAAIQSGALPILVVFFAATGASLQLDTLPRTEVVAVTLVIVRIVIIRLSLRIGLWLSRIDRRTGAYLWTGLISQAGIGLGLASVIATEFPTWASRLQTLLVSLVAIDELVGPLLFRIGLTRAGEIGPHVKRPIIVVSNREPYLHDFDTEGRVAVRAATGGVAVALDALMCEKDGVWIACGDGPADRATVDARDHVRVPPDRPAYALRRLWLDRAVYDAYYGGFANEGLWPLCHVVDVRPQFRHDDWLAYQTVNAQFAVAIDEELIAPDTPVFIQDYHMALVAARLREHRPGARTALFWHIPWPSSDRLRICPWRREILAGLLCNDLVAFQLERDRRNFIMAVKEELGEVAEVDDDRVRFDGRVCAVTEVPIGVDYDRIQRLSADPATTDEQGRLTRRLGLRAELIGLGVDRLDYTKGIPDRLEALDLLFTRRPDLRGRLTFIQVGVPSRSELEPYGDIETLIDAKVRDINRRHGLRGLPAPIAYHKGALPLGSLVALYRLADFCIVSSLHDGMNLVAKEFVAARDDEDGVLVLSALAGSAQELGDALIINPYDIDGFAAALMRALDMPAEERRARMQAMRRVVAGRNVFAWASDILEGLESLWTKPLKYAARGPEDAPI